MNILLGDTRGGELFARIKARGWGRMCVKDHPRPYPGEPWGFDNGAYGAWLRGEPFPGDRFKNRVDVAMDRCAQHPPILAVLPDLVTKGLASLDFSLAWLDDVPTEWPWYLAVQDGMPVETIHDVLAETPEIVGVFLGGSTRFKATAMMWSELAHALGRRFHYARASVPRKVDHAIRVKADSLDSAFPLWSVARFAEFERHLDVGSPQHGFAWLDDGRAEREAARGVLQGMLGAAARWPEGAL